MLLAISALGHLEIAGIPLSGVIGVESGPDFVFAES